MSTTCRKPAPRWGSRLSGCGSRVRWDICGTETQPLPSAGPNTKAWERPVQRSSMSHISSFQK